MFREQLSSPEPRRFLPKNLLMILLCTQGLLFSWKAGGLYRKKASISQDTLSHAWYTSLQWRETKVFELISCNPADNIQCTPMDNPSLTLPHQHSGRVFDLPWIVSSNYSGFHVFSHKSCNTWHERQSSTISPTDTPQKTKELRNPLLAYKPQTHQQPQYQLTASELLLPELNLLVNPSCLYIPGREGGVTGCTKRMRLFTLHNWYVPRDGAL